MRELGEVAAARFLQDAASSEHGERVLRELAIANGIDVADARAMLDALVREFAMERLVLVTVDVERTNGLDPVASTGRSTDWDEYTPLSHLVVDPIAAPTWIAIEVAHANGTALSGARFNVELADGSTRAVELDQKGRWAADDLPAGATVRVTSLVVGEVPPLARRRELGPASDASVVELVERKAVLATGRAHRLLVPASTIHVAQLQGIQFGLARAIVLPTAPVAGSSSPLATLASMIAFGATDGRDRLALIAGHTDSSGKASSNLALSEARARNVELLLRNRRAEWAAHSLSHYAVEDLQHVYRWAAARQLWPCDPGAVDNELGEQTIAARRAFRGAYNHERSAQLGLDDEIGLADWEAIFDLYAEELGMMLSDLGDLATLSGELRFVEPAVIACGSEWPLGEVTLAGYTSADDRRVDVLFFASDDLPDLEAARPGADIYGSRRYRARVLPSSPIQQRIRVQLRDTRGAPLVNTSYEVAGIDTAHAGTTDAHGFTEEFAAHPGDVADLRVDELVYRIRVGTSSAQGLADAQSALNALGYHAGPTDGTMNRCTRGALRNFQWVTGLPITGELDAATERALRAAAWRT